MYLAFPTMTSFLAICGETMAHFFCINNKDDDGILFVLCMEILAQAIRNHNIKGIQMYDKEYKISQYADDTTAFISVASSAENLFELLRIYQDLSG